LISVGAAVQHVIRVAADPLVNHVWFGYLLRGDPKRINPWLRRSEQG
jgi:hypothetical protein